MEQPPPQLKNQYESDIVLQHLLRDLLPSDIFLKIQPHLKEVGEDAVGKLAQMALEAESHPPIHVPYSPFGKRIDEIRVTSAWIELERYAATHGLISTGYERKQGEFSRVYQMALLYLYHPSSALFSCPLAMTDGAARCIEIYGNENLKNHALKNLTSRDPKKFWTSGQWMTEKSGGSDVSGTETIAKKNGKHFELWGTKWFTSSTTSPMAMALARIEGAEAGSRGLSLFYVETKNQLGELQQIQIQRLKDKMGTRALPTAELNLIGTPAQLVGEEGHGVKKIASLFNITRLYNSVCSVAHMRRLLALADDYAKKRVVFSKPLSEHALHTYTMAPHFYDYVGCMYLTFHLVHLIGKEEVGAASASEQQLARLLTSITKLYTGRAVVNIATEVLEVFAGVGYCEDSGIPSLVRDAHVFPIWEGTTNVLSLDLLRALNKECPIEIVFEHMQNRISSLTDSSLKSSVLSLLERLKKSKATPELARDYSYLLTKTYVSTLLAEATEKKNAPDWLVSAAQHWARSIGQTT